MRAVSSTFLQSRFSELSKIQDMRFGAIDNPMLLSQPAPSNVTLVQFASTVLDGSGVSGTVQLDGVASGNTIAIAVGMRTPTYSAANAPVVVDSKRQSVSTLQSTFNNEFGIGSYASVSQIYNASQGLHILTVSTTDILMSGVISMYELHLVKVLSGGKNTVNQPATTLALASPLVQGNGQIAIGAGSCGTVGGGGAGIAWSGAVRNLTQDGTDTNFTGLNGHDNSGANATQDFGMVRQANSSGLALAGELFA